MFHVQAFDWICSVSGIDIYKVDESVFGVRFDPHIFEVFLIGCLNQMS